jgi:predicted GNAT superfamily acetyltransferase
MPQALDHSDAARDGDVRGATSTSEVRIRHLRTYDEFAACVDLQCQVWGDGFAELRPAAILKVCQRVGGVAAGAFDADDHLVGFVFGITGVENGEVVHWSDMLAVRPDLRDHGIGRMLKEFQRDTVRQRGASRIYWTFDPLVARNAHLNINRLGAEVVEYVPDMYGSQTTSALHHGLGTDRFVVAWKVDGVATGRSRSDAADAQPATVRQARILNTVDASGTPALPDLPAGRGEPTVRVAIPLEIDRIQATSLSSAARWRATTRAALQWGLTYGYRVRAFEHDRAAGYGYYILSTSPSLEDS